MSEGEAAQTGGLMVRFDTVITLYMVGEMFSAWGLWVVASIGLMVLAKCAHEDAQSAKESPTRHPFLFYGILAFLVIGLALMWHSMRHEHAQAIQRILIEAYKHPDLWGAKP